MTETETAQTRPATAGGDGATLRNPAFAAFALLRTAFTVAPIVFGVDKFFNWMVDWDGYLWRGFEDFFPGDGDQIMYGVGVLEIAAGLTVAALPVLGGPLVAAWLGGVTTNLVIIGVADDVFWDVALRDFGLMIGAVTLTLLAFRFEPPSRNPLKHRSADVTTRE